MKRIILILITIICSYQLFTLELTPAEQTWLKEHPVIRLGIGESWAPFIFPKENGKHEGFDIDLINLINERIGTKIEIVSGNWNEMVQMAQNKEIDGLAESAANESRREFFNFTKSYLTQYYALATTPDKINRIRSAADIQDKTLALIKGNVWVHQLVESLGNVRTIETDTDVEAFNLVVEGKADASFLTLGMFSEYRKMFFENIVIAHIFNEEKYQLKLLYSIRNDWPELVTIIDKALDSISQEERIGLYKKWFGFSMDDFESQTRIQLTEEESSWLIEHPVIRIAPDPEFPPIEWFNEKNEYTGITAEFMKLIASALDIEFEVVHCKSWDEVLNKARNREVDLLPAAAQTPNRAEYMLFSNPHLVFPGVIITTKKNQNLNRTKELYNKDVGIVTGYVWHEFISQDHPEIHIVDVANISEGLHKVSIGEIDAFIVTLPIALYYIEQEGIPYLIVAGKTEYETKLSIQTRKDWPLLNSIITKTLKAIPPEKKKEIINKWITLKPMSLFANRTFWIITISMLVGGILIVIIASFWNISLAKQVKIKTRELEEDIAIRKKTEADLSEFARQWQTTFDATNEAIWTLDKDHNIILSNETALKLFNVTYNDIIGKKCWEIVHKTSKPIPECPCIRAEKSLQRERMELFALEKWLQITVDPILGESGNFKGAVHIISDITKRKTDEERIRFLSSVVEQSAEGMAIADLEGKLLFANEAWVIMHGYNEADELLGMSLSVCHNSEQLRNEVEPFNEKVIEFGQNNGEVGHIKKDETIFQTYMSSTILKNDKGIPIAMAGVATDITERKKMEDELEKHREHLEELVKERTAELVEKNKRLEEYNKLFIGREFRIKELKEKLKNKENEK